MMLDNLTINAYREYISTIGEGTGQRMYWDEYRGNMSQHTNVSYAVIDIHGQLHRISYQTCFGKLNALKSYHPDIKPYAILVQVNTAFLEHYEVSEEMLTAYFKWLFTESPLNGAFLNTYEEAVNDGVVVINANIDAGLLGNATSAVRLIWESWYREYSLPSIVRLWYDVIRQYDVDPTIAFAFCNSLTVDSSGLVTIRGSTAGHQFLSTTEFAYAINFIEGNMAEHGNYRELREIEGINDVWWDSMPSGPLSSAHMGTWMKQRMMGEKKQVNVFMANSYSTSYSYDNAIEGVVQMVRDYQAARSS